MVSLLMLATGCATGPAVTRHALATSTEATSAFALPPPGGPAVVSVIERSYANGIQQDIVLASDTAVAGQNMIRIQLLGQSGQVSATTQASDSILATVDIGRELRTLFPGVAMHRSPLYAQNSYGPFGYAVGRHSSGDMCLYGWQRVTSRKQAGPFSPQGSIQVRLRVCQRGATERSLLAIMYGYTINASLPGGWNPYGGAPDPDPRLGRIGQPIHPGEGSLVEAVESEPVQRRRPRTVDTPPQPAPPITEVPPPPIGAPIVPPPPPSGGTAPIVPPPPSGN